MNKLALTQRFSRESGVNFVGPTTTIGQVGMYLQLVEWIDTAYEAIQNIHTTWEFLRKEFTKVLTPSTGTYTPTDLSVTDWGEWAPEDWRVYLTSVADESIITYFPYADFRIIYGFGSNQTQTGRPVAFTIKPDDSIILYPIPDQAYTLKGEYFRENFVMAADIDLPTWEDKLHMMIVWRALMYYATSYAEPDKFAVGQMEYKKGIRALEKKYLPRIKWGEPLA